MVKKIAESYCLDKLALVQTKISEAKKYRGINNLLIQMNYNSLIDEKMVYINYLTKNYGYSSK
mgnify:CR=1 FL=1